MDYPEVINELKKIGVTPAKGDFYDYKDFPLEREFNNLFKFAHDYLETGNLPKEIRPARLFYNTNTDNNAGAWCHNNYCLIEIFKGSIFWMHGYFTEKNELFSKDGLAHFSELTERRGVTPGKFMYQMLTIFYLYHEAGHLIQKRGSKDLHIEFIDTECLEEDVLNRHAREHDADWYASTCLATHVRQFCEVETEQGFFLDNEQLDQLVPLALASVYLYFVNRMKGIPNIHYKENSHPHPSVRLAYMVIYFLDNLYDDDNGDFYETKKKLLGEAIDISVKLMDNQEPNLVLEYSKAMYLELDKIEAYIIEIRNNSEADESSCINYYARDTTNMFE